MHTTVIYQYVNTYKQQVKPEVHVLTQDLPSHPGSLVMTRARRSRGARARCDTSNLCSSPNPVSLKLTETTIGRFQTLFLITIDGAHSCEDPQPIPQSTTVSFHSLPSHQEDAHTSSCRRSNYVHS